MVMTTPAWCWTPNRGYGHYSSPWMANPTPRYGYPSPSPPLAYGHPPPATSPAYGYAPARGYLGALCEEKFHGSDALRVFEEMPIESYVQGHVQGGTNQVFDDMPRLQGRVLSVKIYHEAYPMSMESIYLTFASYGVVERMDTSQNCLTVLVQYQQHQMANQAFRLLQGHYLYQTGGYLEISYASEDELQALNPLPGAPLASACRSTNHELYAYAEINGGVDSKLKPNHPEHDQLLPTPIHRGVSMVQQCQISGGTKRVEYFLGQSSANLDTRTEGSVKCAQEMQEKQVQEELKQELEHFFGHAFDLFDKSHEADGSTHNSEASQECLEKCSQPWSDIDGTTNIKFSDNLATELNIQILNHVMVSRLQKKVLGGTVSVGISSVVNHVVQFITEPERTLIDDVGDPPPLEACNMFTCVASNKYINREGKNLHWKFNEASQFNYKLFDEGEQEVVSKLQVSTGQGKLWLPWDPGNLGDGSGLMKLTVDSQFLRLGENKEVIYLPWDPGVKEDTHKNLLQLAHYGYLLSPAEPPDSSGYYETMFSCVQSTLRGFHVFLHGSTVLSNGSNIDSTTSNAATKKCDPYLEYLLLMFASTIESSSYIIHSGNWWLLRATKQSWMGGQFTYAGEQLHKILEGYVQSHGKVAIIFSHPCLEQSSRLAASLDALSSFERLIDTEKLHNQVEMEPQGILEVWKQAKAYLLLVNCLLDCKKNRPDVCCIYNWEWLEIYPVGQTFTPICMPCGTGVTLIILPNLPCIAIGTEAEVNVGGMPMTLKMFGKYALKGHTAADHSDSSRQMVPPPGEFLLLRQACEQWNPVIGVFIQVSKESLILWKVLVSHEATAFLSYLRLELRIHFEGNIGLLAGSDNLLATKGNGNLQLNEEFSVCNQCAVLFALICQAHIIITSYQWECTTEKQIKLQWDPRIEVLSYIYLWVKVRTRVKSVMKSELVEVECSIFRRNLLDDRASTQWDPGITSLSDKTMKRQIYWNGTLHGGSGSVFLYNLGGKHSTFYYWDPNISVFCQVSLKSYLWSLESVSWMITLQPP